MKKTIANIGYLSAFIAFIGAVGYVVSVPLQIFKLVTPLQDSIIAFGFSLLMPVPFLLAMLALHYTIPKEKRFWTHAALSFAIIYATYCTLNYIIQLSIVIPAGYFWTFENQQGIQGPLSILNQTPHSLFWDIDALGYIFLNLSTIFAIPIFEKQGLQKWVRLFFLINGLSTPFIAIAYFYPTFSAPVLMFGTPWAITVPGSLLLLALYFREKYR
ncbi:MAG TPA: hypothetical protein P5096_02675 [Patescibacteria group bacterium]|nr:hypothetical protein [Patescibacteria group bacterium]